uniref:NADH-ubiquinone oxidoreductase chain 4L n=2 Tax=Megymenum TaxID=236884 RepID=A0A4D6X0K3_9HEMI|nr:NADH dehydrogenase subunit 4L [Megymenum gracilicorne]AFI23535.1 NADH dehydrogenase subunit 4L [Megymenum brevicorne]AVJ52539.1 NADH dehydrogenase subunit 4L [Megymenum sp. YW-2018]QCI09387.1 NADH dehydrogenase subunit 4L [Megymenum gracilicorne]
MSLNFMMLVFMSCGVVVFCSTRKHLLLSLLSLEFMVISIYLLLFMTMYMYNYEMYFSLLFLVFSVCEGALGLSVLVSLIRLKGNDHLSSLSLLSW